MNTSSDMFGGQNEALQIARRMDRLPITGLTWRIVLLGSLAWFIESLSVGAIGVVIPVLKKTMTLTAGEVGVLAVASTIGIVIGLIPAGQLADRFGRKTVLIWGIVEYSLFTILCAFSPNLIILVILRFLSGLGMGAVFPLPYAITGEFVPLNRRTTFNGVMDAALSIGYFVAPLLGLAILPALRPGIAWRVFFVVSGIPLISAWLIYKYLPESPRWLSRRGDTARAHEILSYIENETVRRTGQPLPEPSTAIESEAMGGKISTSTQIGRIWAPWQRRYLRRTLVSSIAAVGTFFMFYIVMTYLPLIFTKEGLTLAKSLIFAAIIIGAAIPGKLLNGYLGETWGRKTMYILFMGVAGIGALFFGGAQTGALMILYGCIMSFFGTGAFPSLKMSYAEQYPTPMRTTGAASVETWGRFLGGVVGAYAFPALILGIGLIPSFDIVAGVTFFAVIILALFSKETKNQSLEKIEATLSS